MNFLGYWIKYFAILVACLGAVFAAGWVITSAIRYVEETYSLWWAMVGMFSLIGLIMTGFAAADSITTDKDPMNKSRTLEDDV